MQEYILNLKGMMSKWHHLPQTYTHALLSYYAQTPKSRQTPDVELRSYLLCICPFINQPSVLQMEELLLPQYAAFTIGEVRMSLWKQEQVKDII